MFMCINQNRNENITKKQILTFYIIMHAWYDNRELSTP